MLYLLRFDEFFQAPASSFELILREDKGKLISKCLFGVLVNDITKFPESPKKLPGSPQEATKNFRTEILTIFSLLFGSKRHFEINWPWVIINWICIELKFIYSEKATENWKSTPTFLEILSTAKKSGRICFQIFVAFSEYLNFTSTTHLKIIHRVIKPKLALLSKNASIA